MIDLNSILTDFLEPKPIIKKVFTPRQDLEKRAEKSRIIRGFLNSPGWKELIREKILKSLKEGMGKLLRPSSLSMTETEIKTILSDIHANLSYVADLKYWLEEGERAEEKLNK